MKDTERHKQGKDAKEREREREREREKEREMREKERDVSDAKGRRICVSMLGTMFNLSVNT